MRIRFRQVITVAALAATTTFAVAALAAEDLDHPTLLKTAPLDGASSVAGKITPAIGFPAHTYTAAKDGFARVVMTDSNVTASDNGGIVYRPYLRVLADGDARAWSSNGYRNAEDKEQTATAEIVIRVKKGERFTIIATLGQHLEGGKRVNVNYTLTVKE